MQDAMLQLWCHETFRIIGDRMWDPADRNWLKGQLDDKLKAIFGTSWDELFGEGKDCPPFVSFMRSTENPPYEPVTDFAALKVNFVSPCRHLHSVSKNAFRVLDYGFQCHVAAQLAVGIAVCTYGNQASPCCNQAECKPYLQDLLMTKLEDYASEPGKSAMDLVLFRYDFILAGAKLSLSLLTDVL